MSIGELEKQSRRTLIWVLVYSIPAFQAMLPVEDPDLWWHLRTAQWIVAHGQVPMVDPFSTYGMGKPWVAYSWLFELITYGLYRAFGLVGLVGLTLVMALLIALVLHCLIRPAKLPFLLEIGILAAALGGLKPLISQRSWLFSILFFAIELDLLFYVRRGGKAGWLWILPPLFALWANFHIQFLYGLAAIGFFLADLIVVRGRRGESLQTVQVSSLSIGKFFLVAVCCAIAVLATPYHYHILRPIVEITTQTGAFSNIVELHPMFFRTPGDWLVLALTLAGFYLLGWERELRLFPLLLLVMGAFLGFRARRDIWVLILSVVAIAGEFRGFEREPDRYEFTPASTLAVFVGAALGIFFIGSHRQIDNSHLEKVVEQRFPVKAVEFIRERQFAGPLFNNFDWGGYLIWGLPEIPVSIDNRMNVHGDPRIERSLATWGGRDWSSDPELMRARLVVAEIWRPLVSLLRADARFRLVYEDSTAAVFLRTGIQP